MSRRHLVCYWSSPTGTLSEPRNDCHGLIDCPPRPVVALVLQAALHLLAVAHGVISLRAPARLERHRVRRVELSPRTVSYQEVLVH